METPRSTQPGKGWTVGTPQKPAWMKIYCMEYRFLYDIMEKFLCSDVSKERYKDFCRSPFWVTYVNVNPKSASYFVGKQFLGTFPSTNSSETTGDLLEGTEVDKVERYWALIVGFCFFEVAQEFCFIFFVWEISRLFQLGVPHDLIWRTYLSNGLNPLDGNCIIFPWSLFQNSESKQLSWESHPFDPKLEVTANLCKCHLTIPKKGHLTQNC